jgi:uncharacterized protein (TIGR02996 family)
MTDAHALLQAAWDAGDDATVLLIFADWLEERGHGDAAEMLRLVVAEAGTARHSKDRVTRLKGLRDDAWRTIRRTSWPDMAGYGPIPPVPIRIGSGYGQRSLHFAGTYRPDCRAFL